LLLVLAAVGLVASFTVHALAWAGVRVPGAMLLGFGLFVVWVPTVLISTRLTRESPRKDFWKAALRGCPRWATRGTMALFAYALVNFASFMFLPRERGQSPSAAEEVRLFSGHLMVFYAVAAAVLYSAVHAVDDRRRCPSGHVNSAQATFCERCGAPVAAVARDPAARSLVR
jgi:hypothetical protein